MIRYLIDLPEEELTGKKILLRVDFNVALAKQSKAIRLQTAVTIAEPFRIKSHKETVNRLIGIGAKIMLVAHISEINSFLPIVGEIGKIFGYPIRLVPHSELHSAGMLFETCPLLLLDNIRQDPGEEKDDPQLAESLARGFDFYVNDAFSVCHRAHASVSAVTRLLPSFGGLLMKKEIEELGKAIDAPSRGKVIALGGAKISTKLPVISNFMDKAEKILIGGAIANNFFKRTGYNVGASLVDETKFDIFDPKIIIPNDIVVTNDKTGRSGIRNMALASIKPDELIVDIGPKTTGSFADMIERSEMTVWNGPMGLSEIETFSGGTRAIANAAARSKRSIIGGGDTIAAVNKLDLLEKFSFVSTGGGAMLEFLAGNKLPGLAALGYYK